MTTNYKVATSSPVLVRNVEIVDLNGFARRKDGIGLALNLSLFSSNTDQLATLLLQTSLPWNTIQIVEVSLIILSLGLQLVTFAIMAYLSSLGRVTEERKQRMNRLNTLALILSMITTLINIAIVSFSRSSNSSTKSC